MLLMPLRRVPPRVPPPSSTPAAPVLLLASVRGRGLGGLPLVMLLLASQSGREVVVASIPLLALRLLLLLFLGLVLVGPLLPAFALTLLLLLVGRLAGAGKAVLLAQVLVALALPLLLLPSSTSLVFLMSLGPFGMSLLLFGCFILSGPFLPPAGAFFVASATPLLPLFVAASSSSSSLLLGRLVLRLLLPLGLDATGRLGSPLLGPLLGHVVGLIGLLLLVAAASLLILAFLLALVLLGQAEVFHLLPGLIHILLLMLLVLLVAAARLFSSSASLALPLSRVLLLLLLLLLSSFSSFLLCRCAVVLSPGIKCPRLVVLRIRPLPLLPSSLSSLRSLLVSPLLGPTSSSALVSLPLVMPLLLLLPSAVVPPGRRLGLGAPVLRRGDLLGRRRATSTTSSSVVSGTAAATHVGGRGLLLGLGRGRRHRRPDCPKSVKNPTD